MLRFVTKERHLELLAIEARIARHDGKERVPRGPAAGAAPAAGGEVAPAETREAIEQENARRVLAVGENDLVRSQVLLRPEHELAQGSGESLQAVIAGIA